MAETVAVLTKDESTVQAVAALAGIVVAPIDDDRGRRVYIVSKWAATKECATLADVRTMLKRMGVDS